MKNAKKLLVTVLLGVISYGSVAQTAIDSSYKNWYFDSREAFYNQLSTKKYDVIFFGNSITEQGNWQELIGPKYKVGNRGIGGDNTFGLKARTPGVVASKPKKLFILIGINDIGRGLPTEVILKNYRQILEMIRNGLPKTRIYIQTVLPMNDEILQHDYLKNKAEKIIALNAGLVKLATEYPVTLVDLRKVFSEKDNVLGAAYTPDGIHLHPAAYLKWVEFLKKKKFL